MATSNKKDIVQCNNRIEFVKIFSPKEFIEVWKKAFNIPLNLNDFHLDIGYMMYSNIVNSATIYRKNKWANRKNLNSIQKWNLDKDAIQKLLQNEFKTKQYQYISVQYIEPWLHICDEFSFGTKIKATWSVDASDISDEFVIQKLP